MAAIGRDLIVTQADERIMGIRSASLTFNGESIDITAGENNGVRELLPESAEESIDISGEGIMKESRLHELVLGGSSRMLEDITITFPVHTPGNTAASLTGSFRLGTYEESYPYKEGVTFSFTLQSSGLWVYTPEAEATP